MLLGIVGWDDWDGVSLHALVVVYNAVLDVNLSLEGFDDVFFARDLFLVREDVDVGLTDSTVSHDFRRLFFFVSLDHLRVKNLVNSLCFNVVRVPFSLYILLLLWDHNFVSLNLRVI